MSLIVISVGRERALIAADSRGTSSLSKKDRPNDVQKLFVFGTHTVCGIGGYVGGRLDRWLRKPIWDPGDNIPDWLECKTVCKALQDNPAAILTMIEGVWWHQLAEAAIIAPGGFRWLLADRQEIMFAAVVIRRLPDGRTDLRELRFPLAKNSAGDPVVLPAETRIFVDHEVPRAPFTYYVGECAALRANPGTLSADSTIKDIDDVFATSDPDETGGPIDVLRIEVDGIRWLRRK